MKIKTTVSELTHAELVSLLSAATFGSWLFAVHVEGALRPRGGVKMSDCREDVWAKSLLNGHSVLVCDQQADGLVYGHLASGTDPNDPDIIEYRVGLMDIERGLAAAADGTFLGDDPLLRERARKAFDDFVADSLDGDAAETLLQIIVFNEIIY